MKAFILLALTTLVYSLEPLCLPGNTLCQSQDAAGCCPYSDGVCCPGMEMCCPAGYQCNAEEKTCTKANGFLSLVGIPKALEKPLDFPSLEKIIKCVKDVFPVVIEVREAIKDYEAGDNAKLAKDLALLSANGAVMLMECAQMII